MSIISSIRIWLENRALQKRYRYPKLAEVNKAIFILEDQILDRTQITEPLNLYMKAQEVSEKHRDEALIPYYLALEEFVVAHPPPVTKEQLTREVIRTRVKEQANLEQMNELFRLVFLPDNQQADLLFKPGIVEMLNFLLVSLGHIQLAALIQEKLGDTPLKHIVVKEDGAIFDEVHKQMSTVSKDEVVAAYKKAYEIIFNEVEKLFGLKAAQTLTNNSKQKAKKLYNAELLEIFLNILPPKAQ